MALAISRNYLCIGSGSVFHFLLRSIGNLNSCSVCGLTGFAGSSGCRSNSNVTTSECIITILTNNCCSCFVILIPSECNNCIVLMGCSCLHIGIECLIIDLLLASNQSLTINSLLHSSNQISILICLCNTTLVENVLYGTSIVLSLELSFQAVANIILEGLSNVLFIKFIDNIINNVIILRVLRIFRHHGRIFLAIIHDVRHIKSIVMCQPVIDDQ